MLDHANILLIVAVILTIGVASGWLAKWFHLPSVTGQILAGLLIGGSMLGILTDHAVAPLAPLIDFALGLMAVAVGSHLNFKKLRVARNRLAVLLLLEATLTPIIVFTALYFITDIKWYTALMISTLVISTAPATVLAIVKETASKGAFVTTLIAAVALNNLACILLFELSRTIAHTSLDPTVAILNILGALALGFGIGAVLVLATVKIHRTDHLSALSLITMLLTAGLALHFGFSVLLSCLCLGVTLANLTPDKEEIGHHVFESFEAAIFAIFFMVAGIKLHLSALQLGGLLATIAFLGRLSGKVLSGYLGMHLAGATNRFRYWIGMALTPQAGLAVGLMLLVTEDPAFADIKELFLAGVLATVLLNELIGPILTRISLKQSGDFGKDRARVLDFLTEQNITTNLVGPDKRTAIRQLADIAISNHHLNISSDELVEKIISSQACPANCVGQGLAIPHVRLNVATTMIGAMGISRRGLKLSTPDDLPVHCMILLITPPAMNEECLAVLKSLALSIGHDRNIQRQLYQIDSPSHAYELLNLHHQFEDWNYYLDDETPQ